MNNNHNLFIIIHYIYNTHTTQTNIQWTKLVGTLKGFTTISAWSLATSTLETLFKPRRNPSTTNIPSTLHIYNIYIASGRSNVFNNITSLMHLLTNHLLHHSNTTKLKHGRSWPCHVSLTTRKHLFLSKLLLPYFNPCKIYYLMHHPL